MNKSNYSGLNNSQNFQVMQELKEMMETEYQRNSEKTYKSAESDTKNDQEEFSMNFGCIDNEQDIKEVLIKWFGQMKEKNESWIKECGRLNAENEDLSKKNQELEI